MSSNYRRQGPNSRSNAKHLVQKPLSQVVKPTQILKRPDQASSGDKIISLPVLTSIKSKKETKHVINSCTKPVIEISTAAVSTESTRFSRRNPRNKDSRSSPTQSSGKQPTLTYHSDSHCSEKTIPSKSRSSSSRPYKEPSSVKKEAAAVKLLMVLLNPEASEQKPTLSTLPLKTSSKLPKSRAQEDHAISPLSLLELLQSTPVNTESSTKPFNDNYYAAPQFRKPPRLSELPIPPFLAV